MGSNTYRIIYYNIMYVVVVAYNNNYGSVINVIEFNIFSSIIVRCNLRVMNTLLCSFNANDVGES